MRRSTARTILCRRDSRQNLTFLGLVSVEKADLVVVSVTVLVRKGTEERSILKKCDEGLGGLNSRPLHTCVGACDPANYVNSEIF